MTLKQTAKKIIKCFKNGNKLLIIGNGGSAAMSQHMAAEFICKFEHDRIPLPAIALTTDTSILTAVSNDYNFSAIFQRQIQALGKKGDILIIFTTSDINQINRLLGESHSLNLYVAARIAGFANIEVIYAPREGDSTAHIQESQLKWLHDVCREVEREFVDPKTVMVTEEIEEVKKL